MIVTMKKATLICREADRETALSVLRDAGVVHVQNIQVPAGNDVEKARTELASIRRVLDVLPAMGEGRESGETPQQVVEHVWSLIYEQKDFQDKLHVCLAELERIAPLGDFDPAEVNRLAGNGIHVQLYSAGPKQKVQAPEGVSVHILSEDKNGSHVAAIGLEPFELPYTRVRLPEKSLSELEQERGELEKALAFNQEHLQFHSGDRPAVQAYAAAKEEHLRFLEVRSGMGDAGSGLAFLRGWVPEEKAETFKNAAMAGHFGYLLDEPGSSDEPPTLIRNPKWVEPIKAVFDMIGVVPGYRETDFSPAFLVFLSIFFAMLVGDFGYGAIFLGITLLAKRRMPEAPAEVFTLLTIMSVATMFWGIMTGTYFGIDTLHPALASLRLHWLTSENADNNLMLLCFTLGAVHLTIAHGWNIIRMFPDRQWLAQLGWICTTWTMFFAAKSMVLMHPFPGAVYGLTTVGIVLIVLFMTPPERLKSEWFNHVMLPLNLISNFVDVVSYVRLFAVGAATYAVASAFNQMAIGEGITGPMTGLIAALILFFGHGLNILLAAMGVLVHGVRLNTLEFANHLGLQWKGYKYNPFKSINNPE